MNHLHFTQSLEALNGGGLGSSTVTLHREMKSGGLGSVLCATHGGSPQRLAEGAFEFHRIKPDFLYFSPTLRREALRLVRDADVIHGHGLYVGTNFIFGREARRQCKPLVYHVHGMFEPYILGRSRWKKRIVHLLFENANFRQVRFWRALTAKEADQIRTCGITQPIVVAPNAINLTAFEKPPTPPDSIRTPLAPHLRKTARRMLFLGRLHPKKGLKLLLAAWNRLREQNDWQLVIAGPEEPGHLAEIQALTKSLSLSERIVFTGPVVGESKVSLLHSADLFVLPSHSEGFPMAILEALACEVPVVATHACNFPDISSAQAGWLCESEVESLAQVLRIALNASDLERRQRGENGRRLIETNYTWSSVIKTLCEACAAYC